MKLMTVALVALLGGSAWADAPGDCPHPPKKKHVKRPPQKPPQPPKADCRCTGEQGPPGPQGPKGDPGDEVQIVRVIHDVKVLEVRAKAPVNIRLGVMGTAQAPHGDWAWGPALEVTSDLSDRYELAAAGAIAAGASHERETGFILRLGALRKVQHNLEFGLGVQYTDIDGSPSNGQIDGNYLGAYGAVVYYPDPHLRLEFGPTLGGLRDQFEPGTQLAFGAQGSAFLGWGW